MFGATGLCSACNKQIPAFEMVMRARNNVYHLECFACQQCNHRFCVGDRFYLCDNRILCEYDYEERMVFANMNTSNVNLPSSSSSMTSLKQQQRQPMPTSQSGSPNSADSRMQSNGGLAPMTTRNHPAIRTNSSNNNGNIMSSGE